jgi:hypothetical protein
MVIVGIVWAGQPLGCGSATYSKRLPYPGTANVLVLREIKTSLIVSSGGMFPKNGSSNLPMASSAS